ncbi:MAG: transketolase C-terminal domain-containing protein [Candidatus Thermoplasmatota archaeon]|nr:transketolase C-terminal domain-containing protein [Candidatus Thermoplasmatota archaeon]
MPNEDTGGQPLSQGDLPNLWGEGWKPRAHLDLVNPVAKDDVKNELTRFFAERHDGHLRLVGWLFDEVANEFEQDEWDGPTLHIFSESFASQLEENLSKRTHEMGLGVEEIIPRRTGALHLNRRAKRLLIDVRLCLRRIAHAAAVTTEQRMDWQRWMTRTRALDTHLKDLFTNGLETPDGGRFGGKGFRSTWQEAIVACATALQLAKDKPSGEMHTGDIVAPMIRDIGLALAMGQTPTALFAAQMGKSGSYMDGGHPGSGGRDLHIGDLELGIMPPTAPLPIASATTTGVALASQRLEMKRFQFAPVGEGCSSSGEFWEAMNFAGARGLPIAFMIQNNQIALDTFAVGQSAAETWGDKGAAMGMPSWTIDGSDPLLFHASIAAAREFALEGGGPVLIHVETMRGCGHAHHHDDLYLGAPSGNPPGYVDKGLLSYWEQKDPVPNHRKLLLKMGVNEKTLAEMEEEEQAYVDAGRAEMEAMPWPEGVTVTKGITSLHDADTHENQLARLKDSNTSEEEAKVPSGEVTLEFSDEANAWSYSRSIQNGMVAIAERYGSSTVFMGEDMEVSGAFGMNIPLKNAGHSDLLLDMPLSEAAIIHAATGAALGGLRPVAEIQFGGFAALAMNPLINNAAQLRWRWGAEVPMVVRIPLGAKTRSGPFHANMIESWFLNDPGLVICFPSNPQDAYDLLVEAASLPDPVVYLEHLGMYGLRGGITGWGDKIHMQVDTESVAQAIKSGDTYKIGKANIVRGGSDVTIVTWGAMVHVALKAAETLANEGYQAEVIDLRTLMPFDAKTCVESVKRTGRLLVLQEAQYTGALGHTVSSRIQEEAFWTLEAPPVVIGALDTPVPFAPTLEDHTIPTANLVAEHLRNLCG